MMAFLLLILCTPIASTIVTTAGSPSGIAATAIATAVMNASMIGTLRMSAAAKITAAMISTPTLNIFAVFASCF